MKWNLSKKISLGFGIAFLVLFAVGIISYFSLNNFREIHRHEIRTRQILTVVENVSSYYKDLENGQYGYVLTGDRSFLKPYNNARILLKEEVLFLKKNFEDQLKIGQLEALLLKKMQQTDLVIKSRSLHGSEQALALLQSGESKKLSEDIRKLILQLKIQETKLYGKQAEEADSNAGHALLFIIFGNLMALSFLLVAVGLLNGDIGMRIKTEVVLNRFIVKAEEAKKKEEQFLANMSHEIRTPMNAILGMTHLILNTPLQPKQQSYLNAIKQSGENLMVIINEILDFSKITAGKIDFETVHFNISDIVYGLYNTFKIKADEKGLKLNPVLDESLPDTIIGDPGKLNQVLVNLMGNSIKFTSKGSIDLRCKLIEQNGDDLLIEFSVKDTGIGIPQNKLATIFEDFAQASKDTSRKFGGTGLGLSISKKIVELQGGTINVESQLGEGTVFSFILPYKIGTEKIEKKEKDNKANAQELHGINILLVDDNEFNQVVAVDTLNSLIKNLTIDVAENGLEAIDKLKENKNYDIILMDVQMPGMNGYETTHYIRKDKALGYTNVPIIAMTASATKPEIDRCFESGMTDFVSKPVDSEILLIKISSLINKEKPDFYKEEFIEQQVSTNEEASAADLSFLKGVTSNNKDQMIKYINMFLDSVPSDWERLKEKAREKNWKEVKAIAHLMKPRMNYMGIKAGAGLIKQIEYSAAEEINLELIPELIVNLENILYLTYKQLEKEKQIL